MNPSLFLCENNKLQNHSCHKIYHNITKWHKRINHCVEVIASYVIEVKYTGETNEMRTERRIRTENIRVCMQNDILTFSKIQLGTIKALANCED